MTADHQLDYRDPEWVAEKLGVDRNTVYKHLQDGTIPAVQLGRRWLISEGQLAQWLATQAREQTQARQEAAISADRTAERMDNFSPNAREVVRLAHAEARRYGHPFLGQEHLLLALAAVPDSKAAKVLVESGVDPSRLRARLREQVEALLTPGTGAPRRRLGRTPRARKAMRLATDSAQGAGREQVGTEHLLLGILESGGGVGFETLTGLGLTADRVREEVGRPAVGSE